MTKKLTKRQQFLLDVRHEIDMLKLHATASEKENLNFDFFDPTRPRNCIYGQLSGHCENERAKELMDKSCIRVMNLSKYGNGGINIIEGCSINSPNFVINGEYTGQTWVNKVWCNRSYSFLSALEGYIVTKGAKNKEIIEYIKGNTDTLTL